MIKNIIYILIAIIFMLGYFRYFEQRSLYFPTKEIEYFPSVIGLSYEEVYFDTGDGVRLNAWFIPAENSKWTVLFSHGNGGNISHRIEKLELLNGLGLNVLIFDYRGYGKSSGRPSEKGFYRDIRAAYNYIVSEKKASPENIILYGESLGCAVALDLAGEGKGEVLITESAFSSTKDMALALYPVFPSFLIFSKFDSLKKIKDLPLPKLIIHSQNDEIVPFAQSIRLFDAAPEPKRHLVLRGSHNSCYVDSKDLYVSGIRGFLEEL